MEVKRYRQTKEKLRRRRERLLRVRLLKAGQDGHLKVGPAPAPASAPRRPHAYASQVDLVDSGTESEPEPEEPALAPARPPVEAPSPVEAPPVEAPPAEAPPAESPVASPAPAADADEVARKIKEQFRSSMARVMVQHLNPYRHSEAKAGRITCTADFKHLARKVRRIRYCIAVLPVQYYCSFATQIRGNKLATKFAICYK